MSLHTYFSFILIYSGRGFHIQFDGIRLYIRLDTIFVNNTRGLCGTYDFSSENDFLTHISIVETDIKTFIDDFKTDAKCSTPSQQHPCQQNVVVSNNESKRHSFATMLIIYFKIPLYFRMKIMLEVHVPF